MKPKLRKENTSYNPIGEKLPTNRPPTYMEILKYRNLLKLENTSDSDRELVIKYILPSIMNIWNKIHVMLKYRSELALENDLIDFFKTVDLASRKKLKRKSVEFLDKKLIRAFNCLACNCKLPDNPCRYIL